MYDRPLFQSDAQCKRAFDEAIRITRSLNDAGFKAYFAGGCVRDGLLGRVPKDFDIATDATPEKVREVFGKRRTLAFGAAFGVIGVLPEKIRGNKSRDLASFATEVATFRSDGEYTDGRRPDSVRYGKPEEDALRRDFTINGLFYDPIEGSVIDFVGGQTDLENQILRTIGDANERFDEDKLRMLRAVRFATVLDLSVDPATIESIRNHASEIRVVSGERVGAEMRKIIAHINVALGLKLLNDFGLGPHIEWPENRVELPRIESLRSNLRGHRFSDALACILIEMGCDEPVLQCLTKSWKLSNEETREVTSAMRHHQTLIDANILRWSEVQPVLMNRDVDTILNVAKALVNTNSQNASGLDLASSALGWPVERLNPPSLLTGDDLRDAGFQPGPQFATVLRQTRDAQLNNEISTAEEAMEIARRVLR